MNSEQLRKYGKQALDYICDYMNTVSTRDVVPKLDPGYLNKWIPDEAPKKGEDFANILKDVECKIMPGYVHWNHPKFFAYFPSGNSYPSVIADMITSAIGAMGFSWASNPVGTELETIVLNWFAKALGLPKAFLSDEPGSYGGGALQGSASDCTFVCFVAARERAIEKLKGSSDFHESVFLSQLVAYASKEAHSSVEKGAKVAMVKLRILDTDDHGRMCPKALQTAIRRDVEEGLTPFFVAATLGTTGACAFDDLTEIGKVCEQYPDIWFHVDGAYAGNALILPEIRHFAKGLEYADSFNTNPNKFLLTNFDASAMWVKDTMALKRALIVDPLYLRHEHPEAIDYRNYSIPLSRRFRALKLWFVFRTYGITGLQDYIRNHIALAKKFEQLVKQNERFEVTNDVHLGLVCFRLRSTDAINRELLALINHSGKLHMVPACVQDKYSIRFCVTYQHATENDIHDAWKQIQLIADEVLKEEEPVAVGMLEKRIPKKKLTRAHLLHFSFTRSVSREIFERRHTHLMDVCMPIVFVDTDEATVVGTDVQQKSKLTEHTDSESADDASK